MALGARPGSFDATAKISDLTVAVLEGALARRLCAVVADPPKGLAEIHGRPFLAYLLDQLAAVGLRHAVLCTGNQSEKIYEAFGSSYGPLQLSYSRDREALGAGNALRLALPKLVSDPVLVMHGDSYCDADLTSFFHWHGARSAEATVLLTRAAQTERYGSVKVNANGAVLEFVEKQKEVATDWINAGIYLLSQRVLASIPPRSTSLEIDIFPQWIGRGIYGYPTENPFLDSGTPEDFHAAEAFFPSRKTRKRFVVLDRDGTIIEECSYLSRPEQVKLISGAGQALRELKQLGFGLVVITNQSAIGRGFFDEMQLRRIHERLFQMLEAEGVELEGLYFCPHKPGDGCACRKPGVRLMERAARDLGFDPERTIVIGDKTMDIEMGRRVGAMTLLVRTGYGAQVVAEPLAAADYIVDDLPEAVQIIRRLTMGERSNVQGH